MGHVQEMLKLIPKTLKQGVRGVRRHVRQHHARALGAPGVSQLGVLWVSCPWAAQGSELAGLDFTLKVNFN